MMSARELLNAEYGSKSRNFITPHVVGRGWIMPGEVAYELSRGEGMSRQTIYGVSTAWKTADGTRRGKLDEESGCFQSLREAKAFVTALRTRLRKAKRESA